MQRVGNKNIILTFGIIIVVCIAILGWGMEKVVVNMVSPGGIVLTDEYIDSTYFNDDKSSISSGLYMTYVKELVTKDNFDKFVFKQKGYEVKNFSSEISSDFSFMEQGMLDQILYNQMKHNVIKSVLDYEGIDFEETILEPTVLMIPKKHGRVSKYFQLGDRIMEIDSEPVFATDEINLYLKDKQIGDTVNVSIMRDNKRILEDVTLTEVDASGQISFGVLLRNVFLFDDIVEDDIIKNGESFGGDSAGLMFALGLIHQLHPDYDLARGRIVAGTGTIGGSGQVGSIGDIKMKIITALENKVDIFLCPYSQREAAQEAISELGINEMRIIPVASLEDAILELMK